MIYKKLVAAISACVFVSLTSACDVAVETQIEVTSKSSALLEVEVNFSGDIKEVLEENPEQQKEVEQIFVTQLGKAPEKKTTSTDLTFSQEFTYEQLENITPLTGVKTFVLTNEGQKLTLTVTQPQKIVQAITDAVATQPDSGVLAKAMGESVHVDTTVIYKGGVTASELSGPGEIKEKATSVEFSRDLNETADSKLVVEGNIEPGLNWAKISAAGLIVVAICSAGFWFYRRQQTTLRFK